MYKENCTGIQLQCGNSSFIMMNKTRQTNTSVSVIARTFTSALFLHFSLSLPKKILAHPWKLIIKKQTTVLKEINGLKYVTWTYWKLTSKQKSEQKLFTFILNPWKADEIERKTDE